MISIITGDEDYLIQKRLNELLCSLSACQILRMELDKKDGIRDFIRQCNSQSLFAEQTTYVIRNPFFFYGKLEADELKILENYVLHPSPDSNLVFYSQGARPFDRRLKAYKIVKKNAHEYYYEAMNEQRFRAYACTVMANSSLVLRNRELNLVIERSDLSPALLQQNIEKLLLYNDNIDEKVIKGLLPKAISDDKFALLHAFFQKDSTQLFYLFGEYCKNNDSILPLIALLASQLRFLFAVDYLSQQGWSDQKIADEIGGKTRSVYRIIKSRELLNYIRKENILQLLAKLSQLDERIKKDSTIPESLRFEMLLIWWVNNYESH